MPKRKAGVGAAATDEPLTKRRTRSSGPIAETQPDLFTSRRRARQTQLTAGQSSSSTPSKKSRSQGERVDESLLQESDEDDELNLSPSKVRLVTPPTTNTPRMILHSVEISINAHRSAQTSQIDRESPTPTNRRYPLKGSEVGLVKPTPPSSPLKNQYATSSPRINQNIPSTPRGSPSKYDFKSNSNASPSKLPRILPNHLHSCLEAQKRAVIHALQHPRHLDVTEEYGANKGGNIHTNDIAFQQLSALLQGTVSRGEGNSCMVLGPRGSGKSRLVERCLKDLPDQPIILRLSGWAQHNDRLAMREIAWQLMQQTGTSFLNSEPDGFDANDDTNPFIDIDPTITLPPPSHLPALISVIPSLARPTIVVLDAFDLFALHARQSLLYCLLDTVQSCRVSMGNKGIAVIGVTSRVDTINLLEKRVKSRFSGRMLRTAAPGLLSDWIGITKRGLSTPVADCPLEWSIMWNAAVDKFIGDPVFIEILKETFSVTRDVRMLSRILTTPILELGPSSPFPLASQLVSAVDVQRCRPRFRTLHSSCLIFIMQSTLAPDVLLHPALPYPSLCLLIAAMHSQRAGHDTVTFEMLHECFRDQVRASTSAPVQIGSGGIGMVRCTREVLMSAFEQLGSSRVFECVTTSSASVAKEFVRYRCMVEREDVKAAVEKRGETSLKKWLGKSQ